MHMYLSSAYKYKQTLDPGMFRVGDPPPARETANATGAAALAAVLLLTARSRSRASFDVCVCVKE